MLLNQSNTLSVTKETHMLQLLNLCAPSGLHAGPSLPKSPRLWGRTAAVLVLAATLAGCGSSVKLDEVPVQDRSSASGAGTTASPGSQSGASTDPRGAVAGIATAPNDAVQPAGMARLVYFDYDSFDVRPEFAATLEAHARYLAANRSRRVALEGHTDERGGREYNLALGQKRAEAVRRSLSLLGVTEGQMEAVSFGKEKPAMLGQDEASFARNRRVELTYR
jgi:peptidoglycan-associated lipoprotein